MIRHVRSHLRALTFVSMIGAATLTLMLAAPSALGVASEWVVIDEPDVSTSSPDESGEQPQDPLARLSAARATSMAEDESSVKQARLLRPDAQGRIRWAPAVGTWTYSLRDARTKEILATVVIRDRDGTVLRSRITSIGNLPGRLTSRGAIDLVVADARTRRRAKEWGGVEKMRASARLEKCCWEVDLYEQGPDGEAIGEIRIRGIVDDPSKIVTGVWTGPQIAWSMARGNRKAFGGEVNDQLLWVSLFIIFALVAIDWTRLRRWWTLDVVAILALGVSHEFFQRGNLDASVPLALPPLLWLFARMIIVFQRGLGVQTQPSQPASRVARIALRRVPTVALVVACVALAGLRIGVVVDGGNVIDVGYAGVAGARLELAGKAPWGSMPADNQHGDTYGPLNYLLYTPAVALLDDPKRDTWGMSMPAAVWTAIVADALCALTLTFIGWRWISRRGAALLALAWLACPWTIWAMASSVNDAIMALLLLIAFAVLRWPFARGALIGAAAMVKFAPLVALAPMLHVGESRRLRQAALAIGGAASIIAAGLAWTVWRIDDGVSGSLNLFWQRTLGFQVERGSPFSPWGLYDLAGSQRVVQGLVVIMLVIMSLRPRARDAWQVAAGVAAALIAAQLVVTHWFYLYVPWFIGFVLIVLVAARERPWLAPPHEQHAGAEPDMLTP